MLEGNQLLTQGWWFTPGTQVFSAIKTDRYHMALDVESGVKPQTKQSNHNTSDRFNYATSNIFPQICQCSPQDFMKV